MKSGKTRWSAVYFEKQNKTKQNTWKKIKGRGTTCEFLEPGAIQIQSNHSTTLGKPRTSLDVLENHKRSQKWVNKLRSQNSISYAKVQVYTFTILSSRRITERKQRKKSTCFRLSSVFNGDKRWSPQGRGSKHLPSANWIFSIRYFPVKYTLKIPTNPMIMRMTFLVAGI